MESLQRVVLQKRRVLLVGCALALASLGIGAMVYVRATHSTTIPRDAIAVLVTYSRRPDDNNLDGPLSGPIVHGRITDARRIARLAAFVESRTPFRPDPSLEWTCGMDGRHVMPLVTLTFISRSGSHVTARYDTLCRFVSLPGSPLLADPGAPTAARDPAEDEIDALLGQAVPPGNTYCLRPYDQCPITAS